MKITIPQLKCREALEFANELRSKSVKEPCIFDFSHVDYFSPFGMLFLGASIRQFRRKYAEYQFRLSLPKDDGYAGNVGFFKYISEKLKKGKKPGEIKGNNNFIPITPIRIDELMKGNFINIGEVMEDEAKKLARVLDRGNNDLDETLTYLIREVLRNVPEHAKTNELWICGQYWPNSQMAEIAILDEGIGVYKSITQNAAHNQYVKNNKQAIDYVLQPGISESFSPEVQFRQDSEWDNSGFGLHMVKEVCKELDGEFCIASYDRYVLYNKKGLEKGNTSFKGTAIKISISVKNIDKAKSVIMNAAEKGEYEAIRIKNSFRKASMSSKGISTKK